jgi:hypothetical protein
MQRIECCDLFEAIIKTNGFDRHGESLLRILYRQPSMQFAPSIIDALALQIGFFNFISQNSENKIEKKKKKKKKEKENLTLTGASDKRNRLAVKHSRLRTPFIEAL